MEVLPCARVRRNAAQNPPEEGCDDHDANHQTLQQPTTTTTTTTKTKTKQPTTY